MDLTIIIISYNTKDLLTQCLQSIFKQPESKDYQVIVVDNNSTDGTQDMLKKHFSQVELLENKKNLGFAKANNQATKKAKGDYLLFLNSDTIVKNKAISSLLDLAKEHQAHLSSCQLLNQDETIQPQGGSLPTLLNTFVWMTFLDDIPLLKSILPRYQQSNPNYFIKNHTGGWLGGTALLSKSDTFQALQGFDENMFMYGEDVDLCIRAHQSTFSINYFYQPKIIHLGHASGSKSDARIREFQAIKYIFQKHKPAWQLPILRLWLKIGALLRVLIFGIMLQDDQSKQLYQKAYRLA